MPRMMKITPLMNKPIGNNMHTHEMVHSNIMERLTDPYDKYTCRENN